MEIKTFIGKVVVEAASKKRYVITEIASPYIAVREENRLNGGRSFIFETINGDPISRGILVFEDSSLTLPFKSTYSAYCRSKDAYYEEIGYWMRKD